jgi:uncharacterized protein (TIGR02246 family)
MTDEAAIQQVLSAYSVATSRGDEAGLVALFTEDAVWSVPGIGLHLEGLEAVRGGMAQIRGQFDYIVQVHGPAVIVVSGDTATATSVIRECGKHAGRDAAVEFMGVYDDDLVRTPAGWKFRKRTFDLQGTHDFALQSPQQA